MILESAQILSTVIRGLTDNAPPALYKATHANHPCTKWAGKTRGNFDWLLAHALELAAVYTAAYGKTHKSLSVLILFKDLRYLVPGGKRTAFVDVTLYKDDPRFVDETVITKYKWTLLYKWKTGSQRPTWRNRSIPEFARSKREKGVIGCRMRSQRLA